MLLNLRSTYGDDDGGDERRTTTRFHLNMSGGSLDIDGRLSWGNYNGDADEEGGGGGEMNVGGSATVTCATLAYEGGGRRDWTLNLDGNGTITVSGEFIAPRRDPNDALGDANAFMNLDSGILEVGTFDHNDNPYAMDIHEGIFIIHGNHVVEMEADVAAGYITAYDGNEPVLVYIEDGNTIVKADYVPVKASAESPQDYSLSECPGVVLSWTAGGEAQATLGHDVYFGMDINDVTDANTAVGLGVYMGRQTGTVYPESGPLTVELGTTYYWRIDEVNDSNGDSPWTGDVWRFTVSDGRASEPSPEDLAISIDPAAVVLEWSSGCDTDSHDVYLGTNKDDITNATTADTDLFKGNQLVGDTDYSPPEPLEFFTYYYWRIDEVEGANTHEGRVWQFKTQPYIPDVDMVLWYKLDESSGTYVIDSSGYEHHGNGDGIGDRWRPDEGKIDGCLDFDDDEEILVPDDTLDTISSAITIAVWVNGDDSQDEDDNMVIFEAGDEGDDGVYKLRALVPSDEPEHDVVWRAGEVNDVLRWQSATPDDYQDEWHHYVFVKDETADTMKIYFDGLLEVEKTNVSTSLVNVKGPDSVFKIGSENDNDGDYDGRLDDFRVYTRALTDLEITLLFLGEDAGLAWGASPRNDTEDVLLDVSLIWEPGFYADTHDVYFGTDWDDVNNATTASPVGVVYRDNQEPNTYNPPGTLDFDTVYYWRIDEVNDACDPNGWKGNVWSFKTADFILVDDFEPYNDTTNVLYDTWEDGVTNLNSSSVIWLSTEPNVRTGEQALEFLYENSKDWWSGHYWSEIIREFDTAQDWTSHDTRTLTLYFYGTAGNAAGATEEMFVAVEDTDTTKAVVKYNDYGDANDVKLEEWTEWNILLPDFTNVDMNNVKIMWIGFGDPTSQPTPGGDGTVFFDDIRLYPPKCIPELGPPEDISGNCIVDWLDVEIMSGDWLMEGLGTIMGATPDSEKLELQYIFDNDTTGQNVDDNTSPEYDGTYFEDVNHTTGNISTRLEDGQGGSGNSIHFGGSDAGISIPNDVFVDTGISGSNEITLAMWIKNAHPGEDPEGGAFMWEFREWDGVDTEGGDRVLAVEVDSGDEYTFRDDGQDVSYDHDWDDHTDWQHYAFVRDASTLKIYVDGMPESSSNSSGNPMAAPGLLYYGISADRAPGNTEGLHDAFTGNMDDFRIYSYALSHAEVIGAMGVASIYDAVDSIANLYEPGDEEIIDLKDFGVLGNHWLEEKLWPE